MAKMTKAQGRRRLHEAAKKIEAVYLSPSLPFTENDSLKMFKMCIQLNKMADKLK